MVCESHSEEEGLDVYSRDESEEPGQSENDRTNSKPDETEDLREANENIRQSQGDDATGPVDSTKTGNKPAFDRGR